MSRVTVTDHGAKALLKRARDMAEGKRVRVGVLHDAPKREPGAGASAMTLLEVAAVHEFGAPSAGIPQRSFIRAGVDQHREEIADLQVVLAQRALTGELSPDQAMEQLGAAVVGKLQTRIAEGLSPPLNPETIERKGSTTPLVDTGQLKSSITYEVLR